MAYGSRTVSRQRVESWRGEQMPIMVMEYREKSAFSGCFISSYEIYPPVLKYSEHGAGGEHSTYYPVYHREGCLRGDTFQKLIDSGVLVDKTPDHTTPCYRFYTFPERELKLFGGVFAD